MHAKTDLSLYTGTYTDPWFGDVVISAKKWQAVVRFKKIFPD